MKYFPLDKYKYYINDKDNKIIAVSTYAGKTVRGTATCHPDDVFDLETGKKLAAMRCDLKVREKRVKAATEKAEQAWIEFAQAEDRYDDADTFLEEACRDYDTARKEYSDFITSLHVADAKKKAPFVVETKIPVSADYVPADISSFAYVNFTEETKPSFWRRAWNWLISN